MAILTLVEFMEIKVHRVHRVLKVKKDKRALKVDKELRVLKVSLGQLAARCHWAARCQRYYRTHWITGY